MSAFILISASNRPAATNAGIKPAHQMRVCMGDLCVRARLCVGLVCSNSGRWWQRLVLKAGLVFLAWVWLLNLLTWCTAQLTVSAEFFLW